MNSFRQSDYLAIRTDSEVLHLTYDTNSPTDYYQILRYQLARYFGTETALVFPDGFMAFVALLRSLIEDGDTLCVLPQTRTAVWDAIEIIQRIRKTELYVLDGDSLDVLPRNISRLVLITSGIDTAEGHIVRADEWTNRLKDFYKQRGTPSLYLMDDAHGVGVLGANGRGTFEHFGIKANTSVPQETSCFFSGALDKAFGTCGGFLVGPRKWLSQIRESHLRGPTRSGRLSRAAVAQTKCRSAELSWP